jgi:hypothetical protein
MTVAPPRQTLREAPSDGARMSALDRLELLCDAGTLRTIRSSVTSRRMGAKARSGLFGRTSRPG